MATEKFAAQTPHDLARIIARMKGYTLPIQVAIREGVDRTHAQNALAHKWYKEAANWLGDQEPWQVKAECKLNIGIRMLVVESDDFREQWTRLIKDRFTYEEKLEFMVEPTDYPVTRIMTTKQMTRYMKEVQAKYAAQGVPLTDPESLKYGALA